MPPALATVKFNSKLKMNMKSDTENLEEICSRVKLIPVLVVDDVNDAVLLAQALIRGGLNVLEVTLRTAAALDAINEMSGLDGAIVGAGTILTANDMCSVKQAGAKFGVTPGTTAALLDAAKDQELPLIPGVSTVSEIMKVSENGYSFLKFFPAEACGGVKALSSFAGPLPNIKFCPTGGITIDNAPDYISLNNVICVGGSWVAPTELTISRQWDKIEQLAIQARKSLTS